MKVVWLGLLAGLLLQPLFSQAPDSVRILKAVDAHYNHLHTLRTRYTERYTGMGLTRAESGTLTLKKPGRMLWAYDSPAGKVFVLDGHFAWFYTPGDAQVQRMPVRQMDDLRTPLRFLLGHTELAKELDQIAVVPDPQGFRITGVPKGVGNRVRHLTLEVTPAGSIVQMTLEELDGATTAFAFTDQQENVPTRDSDFTFTLPPGVGIASGTAPI